MGHCKHDALDEACGNHVIVIGAKLLLYSRTNTLLDLNIGTHTDTHTLFIMYEHTRKTNKKNKSKAFVGVGLH